MSGAGLAADSGGNIYFADANGDFDETLNSSGFPARGDYGNAFLKLSTSGGLAVTDYLKWITTLRRISVTSISVPAARWCCQT